MAAVFGNEVRGVTRATRTGAAGATGAVGAFVTLVSYLLVKSGFEQDPETAVVLAGAVVTVGGVIAAWIGATKAGKRTPSDPAVPPAPVAVDMPDPDSIPDAGAADIVAEGGSSALPPAPSAPQASPQDPR